MRPWRVYETVVYAPDLEAALAFYRDALGLQIHAPEDVLSQRVRAAAARNDLDLATALNDAFGTPRT